jgi:hypothetical protein
MGSLHAHCQWCWDAEPCGCSKGGERNSTTASGRGRKEMGMQTSGTFPQLTIKRPTKGGKKR